MAKSQWRSWTTEQNTWQSHSHCRDRRCKLETATTEIPYRATPHSTTRTSPSEALNSRKLKCELPEFQSPIHAHHHDNFMRERDAKQKLKMKMRTDTLLHAKPSNLQPGDTVLMRQPKKSKHTLPFNPKPFQGTSRRGNMVEATSGDKVTRRNISYFKKVQAPPPDPTTSDEEDNDENTEDVPVVTEPLPSQSSPLSSNQHQTSRKHPVWSPVSVDPHESANLLCDSKTLCSELWTYLAESIHLLSATSPSKQLHIQSNIHYIHTQPTSTDVNMFWTLKKRRRRKETKKTDSPQSHRSILRANLISNSVTKSKSKKYCISKKGTLTLLL